MSKCDEIAPLLSGLLDNELSPEETREANDHLIRCEACRAQYEQLRKAGDKLDALSVREPQDEALANLWRLPYSGLVRRAGVLLVIIGYLSLLVYGFSEFMSDPEEGAFGKLALAATVIGGVIVFGVVLIERIISWKSDPYKDIER